jgi:hypothetical protein
MSDRIVPHSPAWFEAMSQVDATKAVHTASIVRTASSLDVCGICGDTPASDYELTAIKMPDNSPLTVRLCDDCVAIRRADGEDFRPMQ